jgi:multicomponent Na+:H+ antiporter subunit D
VVSLVLLLTSIGLMIHTKDGTIAVMNVGSWQAPFGITLVVDMLSSVMLVLSGLLAAGVSVYACFDLDEPRVRFGFFPLMLILLMGVNGAFVTGDLFNLYVWFEVLLTASFILLALGGERPQLEGSIKYVALNLLSSALFLAGIGILYGMAGTLNLAELALVVQQGERGGLVTMVAVMFMMAFGIKAGMFPLYFWLPASYPTPPAAVTALFSGLLTKVGVYSLIRMFTLVFSTDPDFLHGLILAGAGLTMLSGVLAAAAQYEMRKILAVHIVSQIGYVVMGLGLFTKLALTGTIVYLIHVIIVKTNLFLVAGAVRRLKGTYDLHTLGGLYKEKPGLSILFIVSAMSLAGVPPLSGFFAKLTLIIAGLRAGSWLIVAVALGVSLLTLYSMTKIWAYVFWKPAPEPLPDLDPMPKGKWSVFLLPMVGFTAITIAIGVFAGPIFDYAEIAAGQLMDPQGYTDAVLGGGKQCDF